jgi:hypothetical protein
MVADDQSAAAAEKQNRVEYFHKNVDDDAGFGVHEYDATRYGNALGLRASSTELQYRWKRLYFLL